MTRNIVDIIKENEVNEQVQPTEKAQIVVMFTYGAQHIARYATVKKAEKDYKALVATWKNDDNRMFALNGDMFTSNISIPDIISISFVDVAKRMKFIPFQG